jgi:hypothetical protein
LDVTSKGLHQEIHEMLLFDVYHMVEDYVGVCALEQVEHALFVLHYTLVSMHCRQALNISLLYVQ